ncbi:hypothetical protein O7628_11245 [Micromonospora sp. WMMD956]|uniref:hypothetical protein n=1 Tax=Micromonospora sp. WMMD956 TaxID=3016108 RepID=UPI0024162687|nr:hypothetical protein [Micromonospora sp. WMMD956]MDG4816077.1 hypothetical protein [Micromonospora sp. WMMD956]
MSRTSAEIITERLSNRQREKRPYGAGLTRKSTIWFTEEQYDWLGEYAEENGVGIPEVVRHAVTLLMGEES